jgi:DNA polymerase-3 subunit alpha
VENGKGETVIESLIRYGNKYQADKLMTQNTLFGDMNSIEINKPEIPYAPAWAPLNRLNRERELIGMYLSAHPLDQFEFEMNYICNTSTGQLKDLTSLKGKQLKIGGLVTNIRHSVSKAGKPYGVFTLEDYDGSYEFVLYGNNYIEFQKYKIKDMFVLFRPSFRKKICRQQISENTEIGGTELELKIQKIDFFLHIKDKFVNNLKINIPLHLLSKM